MIFLILKIFVYLLSALAAGVGAGWVLRHIAAAKQEEDMQRTLADARARVPQFESLIRSRDEQIKRLKEELKEKDVRINGLVDDVREAELSMRDKERELKESTARHETLADLSGENEPGEKRAQPDGTASDTELEAELARLERALQEARSQAADAMAKAAAAETEEYDRLARDLESEQRRVAELERERELQHKSLRVLHQQLELERERGQRAAAG